MPTLKEIKGRIGSVRSTLKITSAMELVSSAKLRKAQNAISAMRPYEEALQKMLALAGGAGNGFENVPLPSNKADFAGDGTENDRLPAVIIAIASNSSLCGGFNSNIIAKVRAVRNEGDVVYSIGRKMADAMARDGFPSPEDYSALSEHPAYAQAADIVERLSEDFYEGRISSVKLVYTHFVSTSRQVPVVETLLPVGETPDQVGGDVMPDSAPVMPDPGRSVMPDTDRASDVILEPSAKDLLEELLPRALKLKLYAALLDSAAAEHAARTIAMQTATDNAENLLAELTLQYNKGRQQKITSEILDLAGGQAAE
ncbi:MAG: ATP synthase F1 subunit gamma [Bacteroidales bacterium]|nr:ATP synthase F1 subunit gamma [Bacteroidales bacterium]